MPILQINEEQGLVTTMILFHEIYKYIFTQSSDNISVGLLFYKSLVMCENELKLLYK